MQADDLRRAIDDGHPTLVTLEAYRESNQPYRELWMTATGSWPSATIGIESIEDPQPPPHLAGRRGLRDAGTTRIAATHPPMGLHHYKSPATTSTTTINTWTKPI